MTYDPNSPQRFSTESELGVAILETNTATKTGVDLFKNSREEAEEKLRALEGTHVKMGERNKQV